MHEIINANIEALAATPELVALLMRLTDRAASVSATEKLRRSRELLVRLPSAEGQSAATDALKQLDNMVRAQLRATRGSPITIQ